MCIRDRPPSRGLLRRQAGQLQWRWPVGDHRFGAAAVAAPPCRRWPPMRSEGSAKQPGYPRQGGRPSLARGR
eukprot:10263612-Alexandrium_andersonii.AAC.1